MALVVDTFKKFIPTRSKMTPSGWRVFNAPCCQHRGHRPDTKSRAGVRFDDGVVYHCFNCHFVTKWVPGSTLSNNFKLLSTWLGAEDIDINTMIFEALKTESVDYVAEPVDYEIDFPQIPLPEDSASMAQIITEGIITDDKFAECVAYVVNERKQDPMSGNFWWSPEMPNRVIIPFFYSGRIVGYTARKITNSKPKFLTERPPNFVFNIDAQSYDQRYILVCEGPFDAYSVKGVGLLTNDVSDRQAHIINSFGASVIVIPDQDRAGLDLVDRAIELGWGVAFPNWDDHVNDPAQAVNEYGQLFVLVDIIETAVFGKIKLTVARNQFEHKLQRIEQCLETS